MKIKITARLVVAAVCLFCAKPANAQTLIYGITFDQGDNKKIIALFPGSPAEVAGIQPGDIVRFINYKPTAALDNAAVNAMLKKLDEAAITVERNGLNKTIRVRGVTRGSFGRTCVSGDCQTGQGRLRLAGLGNFEYEGQFENGAPVGAVKIYEPTGDLYYIGEITDYLPDGNGKQYEKDPSGSTVIGQEGVFSNGRLVNGIVYNDDGTVRTLGQFDEETYKQTSAYRTTIFQGKICVISCENVRRGPNGPVYDGTLRIREREQDNPDARILLEMNYVNGIPNGNVKAYDYANNVMHFVQFVNGVPREDGLNAGILSRISDRYPIATEVRYTALAANSGDFINGITSGLFHFGDQFRAITGPPDGASVAAYKYAYDKGYGEVFDPFGPPRSNPNDNGGNTGGGQPDSPNGIDPKYDKADVEEAYRQCAERIKTIQMEEDKLTEIAGFANQSNIDRIRLKFEVQQIAVVNAYDKLLADYKGRISTSSYNLIESRRNKIKALRM